jgi:tetratricopeptide (TPR) repeat protein
MSGRPGIGTLALACGWLTLLGGIAWASWLMMRPSPSLNDALILAGAGELDEADTRVHEYLQVKPFDSAGLLLASQLLLERPVPEGPEGEALRAERAERAAEHLKLARLNDPASAALVELYRGKAAYYLRKTGEAERAWLEALRLDPTVPEAGWSLLDLYYLQGRDEEGRRLALRLHEVEPDPTDRVQLLLELVRQDAMPLAPGAVVERFAPVVRRTPDDLQASIALGLGLVRDSRAEEGLALLRSMVEQRPEDPDAWDALLTGLDDSGELELMERTVEQLPTSLSEAPRFARHRARIAQEQGDWDTAASLYTIAAEDAPEDARLLYRLGRAIRYTGDRDEADRLTDRLKEIEEARNSVRELYEEANAEPDLGYPKHVDLYWWIAEHRERSGRLREALAWHRLVLAARPGDPESAAATARLEPSNALR